MKIINRNNEDLSKFLSKNKHHLTTDLVKNGALLFRGFDSATELDELARNLNFSPINTYIPGIAPRKVLQFPKVCILSDLGQIGNFKYVHHI